MRLDIVPVEHHYFDSETAGRIRALASLFLSKKDIGLILRLSRHKMQYARDLIAEGRAEGRARLLQWQFDVARRSVPMLIWLGKQYLGQREPDGTTRQATRLPTTIVIEPHECSPPSSAATPT